MVCPVSRRRAFTLVELLVVIGIIALLISILMPALTKARNQALMVKCQNQGRQIYLACQMFAGDNKGHLPRAAYGGQVSVIDERYSAFTMPDWGVLDYARGSIVPYMPGGPDARKEVWLCPGDLGEVTQGGGAAANGLKRNFSYSFNAHMSPDPAAPRLGIRLQSVKNSSRKIMIFEEQGPNDLWCLLFELADRMTTPHAFRPDDILAARHAGQKFTLINRSTPFGSPAWNKYGQIGRGNYTFFDGHVEVLTPMEIARNPKYFMIMIDE